MQAVSGDSIRPSKLSKHQLKRAQKEARKVWDGLAEGSIGGYVCHGAELLQKSHRKHGKAAAVSAADDGRPGAQGSRMCGAWSGLRLLYICLVLAMLFAGHGCR
jgi:hypothetical protein